MKKKIILRGALGIPIGIAIGYLITIVISLVWGGGWYSPCVPELADRMGNEINAVLLQTVLCALLGATGAASSVIWEIEHWGLVKQSGIFFLILAAVMLPTAWFTYWMEHSIAGFLSYLGMFAAIFVFIWLAEYFIGRRIVAKMNERL